MKEIKRINNGKKKKFNKELKPTTKSHLNIVKKHYRLSIRNRGKLYKNDLKD